MNIHKISVIILSLLIVTGCRTGGSPSGIIGMFKTGDDADALFNCIDDTQSEGGKIIVTADEQCLVDASNRSAIVAGGDVDSAKLVRNASDYVGKIVTFEAQVQRLHNRDHLQIATGIRGTEMHLYSHGAEIYYLDDAGEEVELVPLRSYKFTCLIDAYKIHTDKTYIDGQFIRDTTSSLVHVPVLVNP